MADEIRIGITAKGAEVAATGLKKVSTAMREAATATSGLSSMMGTLKGVVAPALAVFGAFKGATALGGFLKSSVQEFEAMRMATRGATEAQQSFADSMEVTTGADADVILAMMRQAKQMGINEDKLEGLVSSAIGLSEVLQVDLESAFQKVLHASEGNLEVFNKLIPGIRELESEEAKLAKISEVAAEGLKQKQNALSTLTGVSEQAGHSFGTLKESIGEILAPLATLTMQGFRVAAEQLNGMLMPAVESIRGSFRSLGPVLESMSQLTRAVFMAMGEAMKPLTQAFSATATGAQVAITSAMDAITQSIVATIAVIETTWNEFPTIFRAGVVAAQLAWATFVADLSNAFTNTIPSLVNWFSQNWQNLFLDAFNASLTAFKNFHTAIGEGMITLWDWISSGMEGGLSGLAASIGNIAGRDLLAGFEATTAELPELIGRALTSDEIRLAAELAGLGESLGESFSESFTRRMEAIKSTTPEIPSTDGLGTSGSRAIGSKPGQIQAQETRLLTRGQGDDPQKKIEENTAQTVKAIEKQQAIQERLFGQLERALSNKVEIVTIK